MKTKYNSYENLIETTLSSDQFIIINLPLANLLGLRTAAYLMALINKRKYFKNNNQLTADGYFFNAQDDLYQWTSLSPTQQSASLKKLEKKLHLVDVKREGIPKRNYYRINDKALAQFLEIDPLRPVMSNEITGDVKRNHKGSQTKRHTNIYTNIHTNHNFPSENNKAPDGAFHRKLLRRKSSQILKQSSKDKLLPRKKVIELPKVPAKVKAVLRYWEAKGLHVTREGTKTHRQNITMIKRLYAGTAFRNTELDEYCKKFTISDMRKTIDRFALSALNPHYLPVSEYKKRLKHTSIGAFIYSPYSNNGMGRSAFIHYLENEPVTTGVPCELLPDQHPKITSALKRAYTSKVLGAIDTKLQIKEENQFILAAEKLYNFMKKNRQKIQWHQSLTPSLLADWMLSAIKHATGDDISKVTPGWFASDMMFNRRLPAYLSSQALIGDDSSNGGGTRVGFLH